ncbi:MAG: hypothetical protein COU06_00435 [Candidatus Harrisonbacteria bacterium CG10_big_fil_rev_8_21_14_0_10_38_8]|uniref:Glycosyltransferase 2-like domain-containing protein n=1 Tax=Candidatus Harrisonbacteria bacterium CG10_big_fil_rev_8_21_14_0_10_38_8 TaxID=1974582 RepID=A0A2M6WKJ7_9BACT|nr:MAG: hypothetical protein COU06_00435 [Candidatus Harrisonbacteria bacterium CG10_big_fil_rev_8_21_14_0_10_38_8]
MLLYLKKQLFMNKTKVTVVTVVYGQRWSLLKKVADSCLSDDKVKTFIIVDNGSENKKKIDDYIKQYNTRVIVLRQEKNIGYSGAINIGINYAKKTDCDYVFILDDDSVPEKNAIDYFLANLALFKNKKVVLVGNRVDVPGNKDIFTRRPLQDKPPNGTLFEVFRFKKIINAIKLALDIAPSTCNSFIPIVPTEAFVTGGTFLPIEIIKKVDAPDKTMFIYGEDLDYAWRIRKAGYDSYACARPIINDIDITFPKYGDHIFGLFKSETPEYKVYYRMRNSVIISRRHGDQNVLILAVNVIVWYIGVCILGLIKTGLTKTYLERAILIYIALYTGFFPKTKTPKSVIIP